MQRVKYGLCMWTFPQPWEPHSTCVLKAFKYQTLILLHVRGQRPYGSTQSCPAYAARQLCPFRWFSYHSVVDRFFFFCLQGHQDLNKITSFGGREGVWGDMWQGGFSSKAKMCWAWYFSSPFFFFCCTGEKKVLFLLERFPAYTMFPGNLYRPMPIFITCRRNRITRWRFWKGM